MPASRKETVYVSNLALPKDGISDGGPVQFRHRENLSIASSCNKASTCGVRYRFIERVHIDAGYGGTSSFERSQSSSVIDADHRLH
jgi:hypothetical protein